MSNVEASREAADPEELRRLYRKIALRLLPVLFVSYCVAFVDRVNVGFTQLEMGKSLQIGPAQYGFAAGVFFLFYALLETPSNMLFGRMGARKTFLRIMTLWGATVTATGLISSASQFYAMRVLLGVFEAGFFPGMILFLTYWFPSTHRGRATSVMFLANALASTIVGPLSGGIMTWLAGANGWEGWRWVFLLEGPPAILMGLLCFFVLSDRPQTARWLNETERRLLEAAMQADDPAPAPAAHGAIWQVLRDPIVYLLGFLYFAPTCGNYLVNFWLPTILRESGVDKVLDIGLIVAIPMICGCIGTLVISYSSDRLRERRWHLAACLLVAGAGLTASTFLHGSVPSTVLAFCVMNFAIAAIGPLFWTLPPTYLTRQTSPAGIGVVSTLGITAGFISPWCIGLMRAQTGSFALGIYTVAGLLFLCIPLLLFALPARAARVGGAPT